MAKSCVVPDSANVTAAVKRKMFSYTKYGTLGVTVDVVTDKKRGSFYPAILPLDKRTMNIDGKQVATSPGMNVAAEIKSGERRVIEYLLSPIQRVGSESLSER